ncbi:MAG: metallophosphoesterase family protein [Clostridia bacterium]|nr:metallophosphoesterase family protein [Clostridia bacterium]
MKTFRNSFAAVLAVIMLFTCTFAANAVSKEVWDSNWTAKQEDINAAVVMTPGADETQRVISWYSDSDNGKVVLYDILGADHIFNAGATATPDGDYRLSATVTDLLPGREYSYICKSGDWESDTYTFTTIDDAAFTAVYMTDIHVSFDKTPENSVRDTAYNLDLVLETAVNKAASKGSTLDLVLSAGDQASDGLREEYVGVTANKYLKEIPMAFCIGNHDRKSADYNYFHVAKPNTIDMGLKSYTGTDYAFVKGNVLFLMIDTNNTSMAGHREFIQNAVNTYPDTKWRVAVFHHDLYSGRIESRESENAFLRLMWAPVADEFGFDLCLTGHSHYYTISNVMYNNKTVAPVENGGKITDPAGTVYMVSGSINNPRTDADGLSKNIGHAVLTEEKIYNLIDFSANSIVINSYTVESDECIGSLTIEKTSNAGGHSYSSPMSWLNKVIDVISAIACIVNNIGRYYDYTQLGFDIPLFDGLLGK